MTTYGQSCPVAMASEIFAERWTPLILREVMRGKHRFNDIKRGLPRISAALLTDRLKSLDRDGVLDRREGDGARGPEYHLTQAGEGLRPVIEMLGAWGQQYVELRPAHVDPGLLMQWIHEHIQIDQLPPRRVVVKFVFPSIPKSYWLILERPLTELCFKDHGFDDDLTVTADAEALSRVYLGRLQLGTAVSKGLVSLDGPRELTRSFASWLGLSYYARFARAS